MILFRLPAVGVLGMTWIIKLKIFDCLSSRSFYASFDAAVKLETNLSLFFFKSTPPSLAMNWNNKITDREVCNLLHFVGVCCTHHTAACHVFVACVCYRFFITILLLPLDWARSEQSVAEPPCVIVSGRARTQRTGATEDRRESMHAAGCIYRNSNCTAEQHARSESRRVLYVRVPFESVPRGGLVARANRGRGWWCDGDKNINLAHVHMLSCSVTLGREIKRETEWMIARGGMVVLWCMLLVHVVHCQNNTSFSIATTVWTQAVSWDDARNVFFFGLKLLCLFIVAKKKKT